MECKENLVSGWYGQDSLLQCVVKTSSEVNNLKIRSVKWTRFPPGDDKSEVVLHFYYGETNKMDGYSLATPHWDDTNKNVSLLISKATAKHAGHYECEVETSAGTANNEISISFTVTGKLLPEYSIGETHT